MSDSDVIEREAAGGVGDVYLHVTDSMQLHIHPATIAREQDHNSAVFHVTQPEGLDQYACRAEVRTAQGTTYRLVQDGEFLLTNDMAVPGVNRIQLSYSDGVAVMRKTTVATYHVTNSILAVDPSDPEFQDGLAQLQARSFANVTYTADSGLLAFYNVAMTPLDSVIVAGGAGGVPDVPAVNGAYARTRTPSGADWTDFNALRVASLDSPQFAGVPTAPTAGAGSNSTQIATTEWTQNQFVVRDYLAKAGGQMSGPFITIPGTNAVNLGIAIGDNSTGFYRPNTGVLIASVSGANVTQFMPAVCAFFVPIHVGNNVVQSVGDATADTDALNRRTGDSRYLRSGGGPIIAPPGTAPADVGLGVGDAATGFYRQGTSLAIAALGDVHMLFNANRTAQLMWPLAMQGNPISNLAHPVAATDALNLGFADGRYLTPTIGDTRYLQTLGGAVSGPIVLLASPPTIDFHAANKLYVDDAIAAVTSPSAFRNQVFEPNEVVIVSPSGPALVFDQNVDMPPTGFRYVLVTIDPLFAVATNPASPAYSLLYSCLLIPTYEVPVLVYSWRGQPGGLDTDFWRSSAKFRAAVDSSPGSIRVQVFVRCVTAGNPNLIQLGANSTIVTNMRSLVGVQDLGPVT